MTLSTTVWLWVGAVGMFLGTLPPLSRLVTDPDNRRFYAVLASVTGIAFLAYLVMALGYGTVTVGGRELEAVRYVDWLLTTPLLVLYLGWLVRPGRRVVAGMVAVDVVVIAFGVAADLLEGVGAAVAFGVAALAYLVLVSLLVRVLPARATTDEACSVTFTKLRNLTVVLWSIYPVVWLLSGAGFGLLEPSTEFLVVVYLDFISKVGFVVVAVYRSHALDALSTPGLERAAATDGGRRRE